MGLSRCTWGPLSPLSRNVAIVSVSGADISCFSAKAANRPRAVSASISPQSAAWHALKAMECAVSLIENGHSTKCRYAPCDRPRKAEFPSLCDGSQRCVCGCPGLASLLIIAHMMRATLLATGTAATIRGFRPRIAASQLSGNMLLRTIQRIRHMAPTMSSFRISVCPILLTRTSRVLPSVECCLGTRCRWHYRIATRAAPDLRS